MKSRNAFFLFTRIRVKHNLLSRFYQFYNNESAGNQNLDAKTITTTGLAIGLFLSPSSHQFLQANTGFQDLPGIVIIDNIAMSDRDNATSKIDTVIYENNRNNFLYLRYPIKYGNNEPWNTIDINNRADLYLKKQPSPQNLVPQYIINGDEDNFEYHNKETINIEAIRKATAAALEKYKPNLGQISLKEKQKNSEFDINIQTKDKKLIYNSNLSLVVVSYLDYANNTSPDRLPPQYDNPDFIYNNVVRELPLGPEGQRVRFKTDGSLNKSFKLEELTDQIRQQSGVAIFLQDMSTKQIWVTGTCRFANLDGVDQPMYLNWNNQPESMYTDELKKTKWTEVEKETGLQLMTLNVRDIPTNTDLRKISLEIGQSGSDNKFFDILAYDIPKALQDNIKNLTFDPKTSHIHIEFINPLTHLDPQTPIFSYITHFKERVYHNSFSFQAKNLEVLDSNGNIPYFYLNNPKIYHHNQIATETNPLDFNKDTWINEADIQEFLPNFGYLDTDPQYSENYDIYPPSRVVDGEYKEKGDGRIDVQDLAHLINTVREQYRLGKAAEAVNPGFVYPCVKQEIKDQLVQKMCELFPFLKEEKAFIKNTIASYLHDLRKGVYDE
jgi:hypothetical protein